MGRWGDGEWGRWGDGEMGRWGDVLEYFLTFFSYCLYPKDDSAPQKFNQGKDTKWFL
ncbi:hypothetical protein [Okeania sp. KiyG1]|uniref:hypothetical protein n=1 Tax=Okeania sp. KiyG1 TaxID=2720165 RepID=UPI0019233558|nr:hypothetical protein [Okeania sp. KiyG1]